MTDYFNNLALAMKIGEKFKPQEVAKDTIEMFRKTGALNFKVNRDNPDDPYNYLRYFDHVSNHMLDNPPEALPHLQNAFELATMTRINLMVEEIKNNLVSYCGLAGTKEIPEKVVEVLDTLPEEVTKLFVELTFGNLAGMLPSRKEYDLKHPKGLQNQFEGAICIETVVLFDYHPEDRSRIEGFGVSLASFKWVAREGEENLFLDVFRRYHKDA